MNINRTSGKRVSASQRDAVTAQNNQATICKPWKLAAVAFGLLLSVQGLTQAQYKFTTIDVPGATATEANGNSTNAIAGDFNDAKGIDHGFVFKNGVFTTINVPGAVNTSINGINASGRLAGTWDDGNISHAFFEDKGFFTTLDPPGSIESQGGFINAQGKVVGGYEDANQKFHCFIWSNGIFTTFNVPGDNSLRRTVAFGINDVGTAVGTYAATGDLPPVATASCGAAVAPSRLLTFPTRF